MKMRVDRGQKPVGPKHGTGPARVVIRMFDRFQVIRTKAYRDALSAHCGMPEERYQLTLQIVRPAPTDVDTLPMVIPGEWSDDDLVPQDLMWEDQCACTKTTDIASMVAKTHVGE